MPYFTPFQAAFKSKFRLVDNSEKQQAEPDKRLPDQKIAQDFDIKTAKKMAAWLVSAAAKAEREGTTIRNYTRLDDGEYTYEEVPGFTMWGSLYGTNGNFAPGVIQLDDEEEL